MPIDFQDIHQQVRQWGENAPVHEQRLRDLREQASRQLDGWAGRTGELHELVDRAVRHNPGLRCAVPTAQPLNAHFPLPDAPGDTAILAADGSQINPDRHAAVEFCLINVGAFEMRAPAAGIAPAGPGQGSVNTFQPPAVYCTVRVQSELLDNGALYTANGLITEEIVALRRDLKERQFLAELARSLLQPAPGNSAPGLGAAHVVTLTDGPLELFRERESKETPEFRGLFERYLSVLHELGALGVTTAGYVDKPRGDLVVRMLELTLLPEANLRDAGRARPLLGITDADLLRPRLAPGERSAVFAIQSSSAQHFQDELALHFFYLNAGRPERAWITRVEIPAWVAGSPLMVDHLHAVLVHQCRILGTRPYPYVLHRAHEVAVVSLAEKDQLESMLIAEMYRRGIPVGEKSHKQSHKELAGRTRYSG
jgi:hypothetical protein